MRVLIAALLGAIAMFVWTSIAHLATPLATMGISQISNEQAVMSAMKDNILAPGLYFYPWFDAKDPKAMEKSAESQKVNPHGLLIYSPPGVNVDAGMGPMLIKEFLKQFAQAFIAAWIASLVAGGFDTRFAVVVGMFISSGIAVNVSYWNWYHFPASFTLAAIVMEVVSGLFAGVAIAWWLGRKSA